MAVTINGKYMYNNEYLSCVIHDQRHVGVDLRLPPHRFRVQQHRSGLMWILSDFRVTDKPKTRPDQPEATMVASPSTRCTYKLAVLYDSDEISSTVSHAIQSVRFTRFAELWGLPLEL